MANVQISEELFLKLIKFHLLDVPDQEQEIRNELKQKLDAMASRQIYSKYKTATSPEDKEKARQEYLEKRGIPTDFRW